MTPPLTPLANPMTDIDKAVELARKHVAAYVDPPDSPSTHHRREEVQVSDIPQWLVTIFARAESCALDNPADRERLAMLVMDGLPLQRMSELAAETVRHQLGTRNVHISPDLALDVARNALQAMLGELLRLPGES